MDNISEARTEVESIVAPPLNASSTIATSISQDFGGAERHQSCGDDENGGINVSTFGYLSNHILKRKGKVVILFVEK